MSELGAEPQVDGRPTAGAALVQEISEAAERRPRSRNVQALGRLLPFIGAHKADAGFASVTAAMLFISSTPPRVPADSYIYTAMGRSRTPKATVRPRKSGMA